LRYGKDDTTQQRTGDRTMSAEIEQELEQEEPYILDELARLAQIIVRIGKEDE
jgi:hypothetical protein